MILIQKLKDISNEDLEFALNSQAMYVIKIHGGETIETNDVDEKDYYEEKHVLDFIIYPEDTDFLEEIEKRNIQKENNNLSF